MSNESPRFWLKAAELGERLRESARAGSFLCLSVLGGRITACRPVESRSASRSARR
jgi:hypothetical protein